MALELSIFADESGDKSNKTQYFLLTLVFHNQAESITNAVVAYDRTLAYADLPNIPFHSEPLLNGHGAYEAVSIEDRKHMLVAFNIFVQRVPIRYKTLVYRRREYNPPEKLGERMERDIVTLIQENLSWCQTFDKVKIYYDNGQGIVKHAIDEAIRKTLSKNAVIQRRSTMTEYRLAQVADYLCTIELANIKYAAKENGGTYDKFFGGIGSFKKNWLKQARRKLMSY